MDSTPVEYFAPDGTRIGGETIQTPRPPEETARREIIADAQAREAEVKAALAGIAAIRDDIIAANQAVQAASTTAQLSAAVKGYAATNLAVLAALETHTTATANALGVVKRALGWLDGSLADLVATNGNGNGQINGGGR